MKGMPPGPTWHAAKIVECGGQCTTNPRSGGVFAHDRPPPASPSSRWTPRRPARRRSVAAHMLYETANPFRMREPAGTLDVSDAAYRAVDDRVVRVEGSRVRTRRAAHDQARRRPAHRLRDDVVHRHPRPAHPGRHRGLGRAAAQGARRAGQPDARAGRRTTTSSTSASTATTPSSKTSTPQPAPAREVGRDAAGARGRPGDRDRRREDRQPADAAPADDGHGLPAQPRVRDVAGRDRARSRRTSSSSTTSSTPSRRPRCSAPSSGRTAPMPEHARRTSRSRSGRRTPARSGSPWSCSCATPRATPSRPTRRSSTRT